MQRGPKPEPTALRKRRGNPSKTPVADEPLALAAGTEPVKPAELPPAASELWDAIVPALVASGVAEMPDTPALVALCVQWARAEEARDAIERDGVMGMGSMGQLSVHPAIGLERAAHLAFLKFAEHYGLTAAARARIDAARRGSAAPLDDELADVLEMQPQLRVVGDE